MAKSILIRILKLFNYKASPKLDAIKEDEPIFMTLEEARQNTALVRELNSQSNTAKLTVGSSNKYVAGIKYKSHQYYILETHKEWETFFGMNSSGQLIKPGKKNKLTGS